jgi:hypothetical protein
MGRQEFLGERTNVGVLDTPLGLATSAVHIRAQPLGPTRLTDRSVELVATSRERGNAFVVRSLEENQIKIKT